MTTPPATTTIDLRRALKPRDAWWTVLVVDPVAVPILSVLVRIPWVTPILLTLSGACLGLGGVAAFFTGHLLLGAVLFEARFVLDCLDGKLARVLGISSPRGALIDLAADVVLISASILALGWHLAGGSDGGPIPIGLSGGTAFVGMVLYWLILYDIDRPQLRVGTAAPRSQTATRTATVDEWLRRHRLERLPRTIEVETLLLFLAPLTGNETILRVSFYLTLAYFAIASVNLMARLIRTSPKSGP
jgi:phosphatidylglycerophosphate synthase